MSALRPMTAAEYLAWRDETIPAYAADKVASGQWSKDEALDLSRKEHAQLLPDGLATRDNFLYTIVDAKSAQVGMLWFAVKTKFNARIAYVFDIGVRPERQREGHARRAFAALEDEVRRLGLAGMALHVFGHNTGAQALYAGLGFHPTNISLYKAIDARAAAAPSAPGVPDIRFRAAGWHDKPVLSRLLELYQYDMSAIWPQTLDMHGEYGFAVDRYLRNPLLKAFLFIVDGHYAGFGLVDPDVSFPENQYWMGQFFVMKRYRRLGVGSRGARFIFDQLPGRWEVGQMPLNLEAQAFWRRTIAAYTNGHFVEHELHDERWDGTLQCFDNSATVR